MGGQKFNIKTLEKFEKPVVGFEKKVLDDLRKPLIINSGKDDPYSRSSSISSIDLHQIEVEEGGISKELREITDNITIQLTPSWENKDKFYAEVDDKINPEEDVHEALGIAVHAICPLINYVIGSRIIPLNQIDLKSKILFENINLDDITGKIIIQSELIRLKGHSSNKPLIANSKYTVLAKNKDIIFYIDEIDDVGGSSLSIQPADLGSKMFRIDNSDPLKIKPPQLKYNQDFKDYFNNGDNYDTIKIIMLLIGFPYLESILKWIIFGNPNFSKDDHTPLINLISEICEIAVSDLEHLNSTNLETKNQKYINLSATLFDNIQDLGNGLKKSLYKFVLNEGK